MDTPSVARGAGKMEGWGKAVEAVSCRAEPPVHAGLPPGPFFARTNNPHAIRERLRGVAAVDQGVPFSLSALTEHRTRFESHLSPVSCLPQL
jgi:hypothetical protein